MPIYIAKPDTWFKKSTIAELIEYSHIDSTGSKYGIFRGTYVVGKNEGYDTFWHKLGYKEGDEVQMNELCAYEEFERRDV